MTKEEKDKILKAIVDERNYYARERERLIAEEQGKVMGADYMLQRFLDIFKTIDKSDYDCHDCKHYGEDIHGENCRFCHDKSLFEEGEKC